MKKQLLNSIRLRLVAALLFPLLEFGGFSATAQTTVQVAPLSATYTASPVVQFRVSWSSQTATNHPPKVWVIIDYDKVENNVAAHNWQPATIVGTVQASTGTISQQSARGFFLEGAQTDFSATVTVALSGMPAQFNWCAFALDYPPNATLKAGGGYDLHGTPPFTITYNNGSSTTTGETTFNAGCITAITDLTGNPAGIVPDPPGIQLSAGNSSQTATQGVVLPALKYATTNATGATLTAGSFPAGVSGTWTANTYTISGTPTAAGTFNYTVTTTNSNGCTNASATGTITVLPGITYTGCTAPTLNLGEVGFTSNVTYSRNGLTISSPVTATYCAGRCSSFDGGSSGAYKADCAPSVQSGFSGHLFSWCMVAQYASQLCPSPWRVPTKEDHCKLVNNSETTCTNAGSTFNGVVGYAHTGSAASGSCVTGSYGFYWSSTENNGGNAYNLYFDSSGTYPQNLISKNNGFALRCVRDVQ
jgi:uncharacterized protein (TIGR02145 family)